MLRLLRNKGTQKKIYMGLAVVVVFSFVISGVIIGQDDKKALSSLAKFEKRNISVQEYLDSYRAVQRQAEMMYGDKLNQMRDRINFKNEAWDRLLLLEYAKKHQIRAGDSEVIGWVTKQTGFQKDGKFDDTFYKMYVERGLRSTPRQFEEETRQMLTIGKVQDKLKETLKLTEDALKELYKEERSEKDLVYVLVTGDSLEAQVSVTDEDIQKLYDLVKDSLTSPEKAKLSYITTEGETPKETGFFSRNDGVPELKDWPDAIGFAFSSSVGDTSPWYESAGGRARVSLTEKQAEHPMSLEEAKEELKKRFRQDEAKKLAVSKLNEIKAKIKDPADFETVLTAEGLKTEKLEKYRKGTYPAGIWPSENLQNAVEKLKKDEISDAFEVPKGAMLVKVTAISDFDEKKFDEDKKDFREKTENQNSGEEMKKVLEEMRGKLSLNVDLMKELFPAD